MDLAKEWQSGVANVSRYTRPTWNENLLGRAMPTVLGAVSHNGRATGESSVSWVARGAQAPSCQWTCYLQFPSHPLDSLMNLNSSGVRLLLRRSRRIRRRMSPYAWWTSSSGTASPCTWRRSRDNASWRRSGPSGATKRERLRPRARVRRPPYFPSQVVRENHREQTSTIRRL